MQGFSVVTMSELETISGGWYACFHIGLFQEMARVKAQEGKLMDFLSKNIAPK
jgi:hypothetical protein